LLYYLLFLDLLQVAPPKSHDDALLVYSSLSTHRSTYPTWVLVRSLTIPTANNLCQDLFSCSHAIAVPPLVNDIAESLTWLLREVQCSLAISYDTIAINLQYVCECNNNGHTQPFESHFKLKMLPMGNIMLAFLPALHENAMMMLRFYHGE
jgi:hypothetical protein